MWKIFQLFFPSVEKNRLENPQNTRFNKCVYSRFTPLFTSTISTYIFLPPVWYLPTPMSLNFKDLAPFRLSSENYIQIPVNLSLSSSGEKREKTFSHAEITSFCLKIGKEQLPIKHPQIATDTKNLLIFLKCHNCIHFTTNYTNLKLHGTVRGTRKAKFWSSRLSFDLVKLWENQVFNSCLFVLFDSEVWRKHGSLWQKHDSLCVGH